MVFVVASIVEFLFFKEKKKLIYFFFKVYFSLNIFTLTTKILLKLSFFFLFWIQNCVIVLGNLSLKKIILLYRKQLFFWLAVVVDSILERENAITNRKHIINFSKLKEIASKKFHF